MATKSLEEKNSNDEPKRKGDRKMCPRCWTRMRSIVFSQLGFMTTGARKGEICDTRGLTNCAFCGTTLIPMSEMADKELLRERLIYVGYHGKLPEV